MTDWLPWLSAIGIIFTLVALAAAAAAFYRATAAKATIEIQGQTIQALQQRLEQVLADNTAKTTEVARITAEKARADADNVTLRDLLSGKADIERVESLIDTHHRQVMADRETDRVSHLGRFDHVDRSLDDIKGLLQDRRAS